MKAAGLLFTGCLVMVSGAAAAQGNKDLHAGDTVYAVNLPFCTTLADAEKVADAGRKTGNAYSAFMQDNNCKSGRGAVVLMKQVDQFPDSSTSSGHRYIVEVKAADKTVYGLLGEPVTVSAPGIAV